MRRGLRKLLLAVLAGALAASGAGAQTPAAEAQALESIRGQIVALDLEKALGAIKALVERSDVSLDTRADALDLRAQAHVASDDLGAAEKDFRAILELRPDYTPHPDLFTKRALERFTRVRTATVGSVHVDVDPPDAILSLDGRPVVRDPAGAFKGFAGDRTLHVERRGFDGSDVPVRIAAGRETLLKVSLVPNARDLVVRTDVPGVSVAIDGTSLGSTAVPPGASGDGGAAAELLARDVPIGEHAILLQKSCYATETRQEFVRVDLADRSAERLAVVTMRPARARVAVTGGGYLGELRVDGESVAQLPVDSFAMCPGRRAVEAVAAGRVVWSGMVEAGEADMSLDLTPRPSAVLVGAEWPKSWSAVVSSWSFRARIDTPSGSDLTKAAAWAAVPLPPGTDIAVGIMPRGGVAGEERVFLYSPALGAVEERTVPPSSPATVRNVRTIEAAFVDSEAGVIVAAVNPGGAAALAGIKAGDRIVSLDGRKAGRVADVDAAVRGATGASIALELAAPGSERRALSVPVVEKPWVERRLAPGDSAIVRAGWAAADAAAGGPGAAAAFAQLATLLERAGRTPAAADAWRKVRALAAGNPSLTARADYALGQATAAVGSAAEATASFTRAKAEAESAGDAALAAAAADHLADLGIAGR
jgi:hypothetical protein